MSDQKHYAFIPKTTLVSEQYKSMKKNTRLVYIYMVARRAGKDEYFPYSYKEMRKDGGFRYEAIADGIKELKRKGFLEYEHGGLELNYNNYYLDPAWLEL